MPVQKALLLPKKQGAFALGERAVPAPGPGELLVKLQATALNPVDWKIQVIGFFIEDYPAVLGTDAAGTVAAVGEGVTGFAEGDRVFYQGNFVNDYATFQQYGLANADVTAKIPSALSFDQAASIPLGLATAAIGLYHPTNEAGSANLSAPWEAGGRNKYANTPFVVFGGSSSVGQYVIQLARLSGFAPIVATASPHNAPLLKALGATHVVDRALAPAALRAEIAARAGAPVPTVYDAISAADTQRAAYGVLAAGGTLVVVLDEAIPAEEKEKGAGRRVAHVYGNVNPAGNRAVGVGLYAALPGLIEAGELKPNVVEVLSGGLEGIVGGLDRLQHNLVSGTKLIARPQETI